MNNNSRKIIYFIISDVVLCLGTLGLIIFSGWSLREALASPIMIFQYIYISFTWVIYLLKKK